MSRSFRTASEKIFLKVSAPRLGLRAGNIQASPSSAAPLKCIPLRPRRDLNGLRALQSETHRCGALQELRAAPGDGPAEGAGVGEGEQLQEVIRGRALQQLVAGEEDA